MTLSSGFVFVGTPEHSARSYLVDPTGLIPAKRLPDMSRPLIEPACGRVKSRTEVELVVVVGSEISEILDTWEEIFFLKKKVCCESTMDQQSFFAKLEQDQQVEHRSSPSPLLRRRRRRPEAG